jgi:3-oxoacyl-[acyl-carrier protein] reductase
MRLAGKVAIITGAGQGIGKEYARRFLAEGAKVAIADYDRGRGEAALAELGGSGDVAFVETDISDETSASTCAATVAEQMGGIDVLVNNAALYYDMDYTDNSLEYLKRVMDVNLHGCWLMTRAVAPYMVERGGGSIVNQSSTGAYLYVRGGEPKEFTGIGSYAYAQSKWGVIGLTKLSAGELGQWNIRVNCIAPGVTMTEATKKIVPDSIANQLTASTALRRTLQPEDLAGTAAYFASDDSRLVTGQVLCVDAGFAMPA